MIVVKTYNKDNNILMISIKGHANYKEYGNDIVCASVSSIALCTVNAILTFNKESISVIENDGLLVINVLKKDDSTTKKLLINMLRCLKDVETDYPANIKISEEE